MLKIGMLTSGGDCQALNAAMRGVAKGLFKYSEDVQIYGFTDGYKGLMDGRYRVLSDRDFCGLLTQGGTILGTSRMPYKSINEPDEKGRDKIGEMIKKYNELKLNCLVILGGNGTHKTANRLSKEGLNIITLPKTIDNDIYGTDISFGFQSAVDVATNTIDCIHSTAASHSRVFVVELMGHKTGWLTINAGLAGGADVILIPEIPYNLESIVRAIKLRQQNGKKFTIIAVAEGCISATEARLGKKEFKEARKNESFPSIAYRIADEITKKTSGEVRITIPGHVQRGGVPCPYDRVLATQLGAKAAELIINNEYGKMVCVNNNRVTSVKLDEVAGKLKLVPADAEIIKYAEAVGICMGR